MLAHGKALRLGAARRPIVGRKCDAPEAWRWLIKFDADTAFVIYALADIYDFAANLFAGFYISQAKMIADVDRLFHENKRAMCVDDLSYGFLSECCALWLEASDDDVNG